MTRCTRSCTWAAYPAWVLGWPGELQYQCRLWGLGIHFLSLGNFVYVPVFGGAGSLLLQGPFSPGVMLGPLTAVLSLVEHRLSGKQGSGVVAPGL